MPAPEPPASAGARLINGTTDCSVRALVSLLALSAIACSPSTSSPDGGVGGDAGVGVDAGGSDAGSAASATASGFTASSSPTSTLLIPGGSRPHLLRTPGAAGPKDG